MAWAKPHHSRGQVDAAGLALISVNDHTSLDYEWEDDIDAYENALPVINNWRSAHSYPLQVLKMTLRTRAKGIATGAIIAQRLKRLKSIASKLSAERNMHMKLSQMQDIGGCRAVMPTVRDVEKLVARYEVSNAKNPSGRPE